MDPGALPSPSRGEQVYCAQSNHGVAFAKLVNDYAELYDKWENLTSDARRKREEADSREREAHKLRPALETIANQIREHMVGKAIGDPSPDLGEFIESRPLPRPDGPSTRVLTPDAP